MDTLSESLAVYRELAEHYEQIGQASMRDRFLMLAADAALQAGLSDEAERLRQLLLAGSRHHMLRPYNSFAEAASVPDVQTYLDDMRANYPLSQARDLLVALRSAQGPAPAAAPAQAPTRPIPPTAPLLDMNAAARTARIDSQPIYKVRDEDPPAQPARPRSQPLPGRKAAPVPTTQAVPAPVEPTPRRRPAPPAKPARRSGGWFSVTLSAIVLTALLALTAFVLARPFLPTEWLH